MDELPIHLKKYFSKETLDSSATVSYWLEIRDQNKGAIGFFISLSGSNGFSVERVAKFMWDSFRESYLESKDDSTNSLKSAMKSAQKRLREMIKNEEGISEMGVDLHMCGVAIVGEKILLSKVGNPEVILIRENKLVNISKSLPSYEGIGYKEEIPVGGFDLKKLDIFLFSTPQLAESVTDLIDKKEEITWHSLTAKIDSFSEGLVGSQYIWLIGFRMDETPRLDLQRPDEIESDIDKKDDDTEVIVEGPEIEAPVEGEKIEVKPKFNFKEFFSKVVSKVKEWWTNFDFTAIKRNIGSFFTSFKLRGGPKKKIFVEKSKGLSFDTGDKKRKYIGIAIIIAIVGVVVFAVVAQRNRAYNEEITDQIEGIQSDIEEAEEVWKSDEMQAIEILERVDGSIGGLEEKKLNSEQQEEIENLKSSAQDVNDLINRIIAVTDENLEILLETYLEIGESANVTDIAIKGDSIYLVDNSTHGIYRYDLGDGGVEAIGGSQSTLKEPVLLAIGEKYMFVYDNKIGMFSLDMEEAESDWEFDAMPELSARTIEEITDIETFGDNIYILKRSEARVLKSYPAGYGYSYPEEYFRHGAFDKATDLLIDGNIYVIGNGSDKVYKYYGGQQDQFSLTGFDTELGNVRCGFTNLSDSRPLYIYDADNERVVVIEKGTGEKHPGQGVMTGQYVYRGSRDDIFKDVKEILVDGDEEYMYVLDETRVLRISI